MEQFTSHPVVAGPCDGSVLTFPDAWVPREVEVRVAAKNFSRLFHCYKFDGHCYRHTGWKWESSGCDWGDDVVLVKEDVPDAGRLSVWRLMSDRTE